tara:strand:- start:644 stop:844 length:201 start_codon:yes stop_codon:yes gene_type:complete
LRLIELACAALEPIKPVTAQQIAQLESSPRRFDDRFDVPHDISWSEDVCDAAISPRNGDGPLIEMP